jgi:hypothetical protein
MSIKAIIHQASSSLNPSKVSLYTLTRSIQVPSWCNHMAGIKGITPRLNTQTKFMPLSLKAQIRLLIILATIIIIWSIPNRLILNNFKAPSTNFSMLWNKGKPYCKMKANLMARVQTSTTKDKPRIKATTCRDLTSPQTYLTTPRNLNLTISCLRKISKSLLKIKRIKIASCKPLCSNRTGRTMTKFNLIRWTAKSWLCPKAMTSCQ